MRVTNKVLMNTFIANLMRNEAALQKKSMQVYDGKRIHLPSDDPVGTARSMMLNTNITEISQYTTNCENAISWLNSSDEALMGVDRTLQRVYELVVQGASDTSTPTSRLALATEVDKAIEGLMELANTSIDNRYLFSGEEVLTKAYNLRAVVFGDIADLQVNPINITIENNSFKIKLNDGSMKTIFLTPRTYDGTAGNTLEDLAADIQDKLNKLGFTTPVYVKVTPDNKLQFYAGKRTESGVINTLVLKEGPALKTTGKAVLSAVPLGPNEIDLDINANTNDNYYNGWKIMIIDGTGKGQVRTVSGHNYTAGVNNRLTVDAAWDIPPDTTSTYVLIPLLEGKVTGAAAGPPDTIALDPGASTYPYFYDSMDITIMSGPGAGQTRRLIYNGGTYEVDEPWTTLPTAASTYTITPHLAGMVGGSEIAGSTTIKLDANAPINPNNDDLYNGASITITNTNGTKQTRKIINYDAVTQTATVDAAWTSDISAEATFKIGDTTLNLLGLEDQASTKDVVGNQLDDEVIVVSGKYPLTGMVQGTTVNSFNLSDDANSANDYYNNWTVTIISGKGAGQTTTITDYVVNPGPPVTKTAIVNPPWTVEPDATSAYAINPPTTGISGIAVTEENGNAQGTPAFSVILDVNANAADNYYNGWMVSAGGENHVITGYDGETKVATFADDWVAAPGPGAAYVLTPPPNGIAQTGAGTSITLDTAASAKDNYYNGWKVKITSGTGAGQTADITGYNGATKEATVNPPWGTVPDNTSVYTLVPPVASDQIRLYQGSASEDFYVGMPITICDGYGKGQSRTIIDYDPVSQVATVDKPWDTIPDQTSRYSIDANYYVNTNSKFKITIAGEMTQEISLDGGNYNLKDFAKHMEAKINARGGEYANIKVSVTNDNRLRIGYRDPDPDDNDAPKDITLESGSMADILLKLGFADGTVSESLEPNYEGDKGVTEYEISAGVRIKINLVGDGLFDPIFQHLKKISIDLRAGNTSVLSKDIELIRDDMEQVVVNLGEIGAKVNRLEKGVNRFNTLNDNIIKLISHIEDVDLSEAIMQLRLQEAALQAALQAGARLLPPTLMDYLK